MFYETPWYQEMPQYKKAFFASLYEEVLSRITWREAEDDEQLNELMMKWFFDLAADQSEDIYTWYDDDEKLDADLDEVFEALSLHI